MEEDRVDLSLICRTCKCITESPKTVFSGIENGNISAQNPRIDEMLMACAAVQVSYGDGLPTLMCELCCKSLQAAFQFKKQCETVDASLKEYCKNMKLNAIKQELQSSEFMESLNTLSNFLNSSSTTSSSPTNKTFSKDETSVTTADLPEPSTSSNNVDVIEINEKSPFITQNTDYIQFLDNNQLLLTCKECIKHFSTLDGLRSHKRLHAGTMFKCKQCDKEYTRKNHLERHEASHGKRKVHVCKICNKTLTRMEHLKRHLITHLREKPHNCKTCNRGFNRVEHLHNHMLRCRGEILHICPVCNKAFNREDSLEVHKQQHDKSALLLPTIENLDNIEEHYFEVDYDAAINFSDNSDLDDCFEPQIEVTEAMDNNTKIITHSSFNENSTTETLENNSTIGNDASSKVIIEDRTEECLEIRHEENGEEDDEKPLAELTGIKSEEGQIQFHVEEDENDQDEMDYGDVPGDNNSKDFENYNDNNGNDSSGESSDEEYLPKKQTQNSPNGKRRGRPRIHPPKPKNNSGRRGRPLGSKGNRRKHRTKQEDDFGDFPCPVCSEYYDRLSLLDKHAKEVHPELKIMGEKKFYCDICQKGFTTEKYRDVHMKAHNGEKKFQCKVCEKTFLSKSHLTEHMKFHNEHSKKFLCSECGQRFIRNDYLVIHMRRHRGEKPFKCKFCGKGFPRTTDLTVHERYHTGEKTHLCTVCGRGFGRAYNLTVHMRTHTGEKPYQCTYCDAAFAQGNDLKAHIRRHTGERFQCDLCTESFLMGYLLTQHKRTVHGLNVVSNIRRLQPIHKLENPDEPPPITIPLPKPCIPENLMFNHLLQPSVGAVGHQHHQHNNLQHIQTKQEKIEDPPPLAPLTKQMLPETLMFNHLQAQLSISQMHYNSQQRPAT